jgi:hypothetical protein
MAYVEGEMPIYAGNNNGGFGGMDGLWGLIALAIVFGGFGGNGFGWGGNNNGSCGNMLYDINANTNRGFDQLSLATGIDGVQTAVSNGFANAEVGRCNQTTTLLQAVNGLGTQFQNCCCENRLATADLKYTVATENCADRQALQTGIRDIIDSNTRNTQAILDKLCQQEIDAKNDLIATLRSQVSMADLRASQTAQTAQILAGQNAEVDALYNRLSNCPVPSTPVYGRQPIFTCGGGCGCNGQNIQ